MFGQSGGSVLCRPWRTLHLAPPVPRPCRMAGGTRPMFRPAMKAPLEPSLAGHFIKEVRFCKREVPGWDTGDVENLVYNII